MTEYTRALTRQLCAPPRVQHQPWLQLPSSHRRTTRTQLQVRTSTTIHSSAWPQKALHGVIYFLLSSLPTLCQHMLAK